jgi:hypothetical protein
MESDLFALWCNGTSFSMEKRRVSTLLTLFSKDPSLLNASSYRVQSNVSSDLFAEFLRAFQGERININGDNVFGLCSLSEELGFSSLSESCRSFAQGQDLSHCTARISSLEDRMSAHEHELASLQSGLARLAGLEAIIRELKSDIGTLKSPSVPTQTNRHVCSSLFRGQRIRWLMQLYDSDLFEICWGISSDSDLPLSCTIWAFETPLVTDSEQDRFTALLTKVASVRSPCERTADRPPHNLLRIQWN